MKNIISWNLTPCNLVKAYRYFGGTYCLLLQGQRMVEVHRRSVRASVNFCQTTWSHVPEDSILQNKYVYKCYCPGAKRKWEFRLWALSRVSVWGGGGGGEASLMICSCHTGAILQKNNIFFNNVIIFQSRENLWYNYRRKFFHQTYNIYMTNLNIKYIYVGVGGGWEMDWAKGSVQALLHKWTKRLLGEGKHYEHL
jgi:hypothetical protein